MDNEFTEVLRDNSEVMPIIYAKGLTPRIENLLNCELPQEIRRQLNAVKSAVDDPKLKQCTGLNRLHYYVTAWEKIYKK